MNNLLKAIDILHLHLNNNINGNINNGNKEQSSVILSEKNNNLHTLFGYCDLNKCVLCSNTYSKGYKTSNHFCQLYNLQKKSSYCKSCNNNKYYLKNLHKIAYSKKNINNTLCIDLRKKFDKISKLEELYNTETINYKNFKESLKINPIMYIEARKKLANYNKKKKKIQKQILLENNKLIDRRYNYIILFRTIDV